MRTFDRTCGRAVWTAILALLFCVVPAFAAAKKAERVSIEGYAGEAMEPFLSRDGRFLFFNTRNDPGANTDIHFAEAQADGFAYRGALHGTISYDLDAVPTMSGGNRFCFVSPRDYRRTRISVLCGAFDGKRVNLVEPQPGMASERLGRLIFDVEVSADGRSMVFAEGTFSGGEAPDEADLDMAILSPRGFLRQPGAARIFDNINTGELEYAPALSDDGLELYFTRPTGIWPFRSPKIFRATRNSTDQPFGKPVEIEAIDGFVEGPTVAEDGTLYFHKRVSGRYEIWRLPR